ncbi:sensor histidine kinase [Pararcticibacter amylolyticus]|uniref:Oxygen sensor histidine kinase NreB n=1 Tax=Pararcticibacter amylolyticus TaxID=2173175 RepID=A0A2U2PBD1_9SPHI|nr:ATP-binding protein [Pararcticibacter amylolyticus]PWG78708.1 hypothetical protein DDR33_21040 [Pararcticibacter amylolyticus]
MWKALSLYFIPPEGRSSPELLRKYSLVVNIILITVLFDMDYAFTTVLIGLEEGTKVMLFAAAVQFSALFALKRGSSLLLVTNVYVAAGVLAVLVSAWYSGGFRSPVLPWLSTSPIVAMLMAGRRTGFFWMAFNTVCVLVLAWLSGKDYAFPVSYDRGWENMLSANCYAGLVLIIFSMALVFENGKNAAIKRLEEKSLLLAEEKRKTALYTVSQEIHDNVGQTLSIIKLNLHLLDGTGATENPSMLRETIGLTQKAIADIRNLSSSLYTENIREFNLPEALRADLALVEKSGAYRTFLNVIGKDVLDPKTGFILFRIAKEAINNILKHADADTIRVDLDFAEGFSLRISDNGRGIGYETGAGQGMYIMKERMGLLGGDLEVFSDKGKGTSLVARIPAQMLS